MTISEITLYNIGVAIGFFLGSYFNFTMIEAAATIAVSWIFMYTFRNIGLPGDRK